MANMAMELNIHVLLVTAEGMHADVNESSLIITICFYKQRPSRRSEASIFPKNEFFGSSTGCQKNDWWIDDDDDDDGVLTLWMPRTFYIPTT